MTVKKRLLVRFFFLLLYHLECETVEYKNYFMALINFLSNLYMYFRVCYSSSFNFFSLSLFDCKTITFNAKPYKKNKQFNIKWEIGCYNLCETKCCSLFFFCPLIMTFWTGGNMYSKLSTSFSFLFFFFCYLKEISLEISCLISSLVYSFLFRSDHLATVCDV